MEHRQTSIPRIRLENFCEQIFVRLYWKYIEEWDHTKPKKNSQNRIISLCPTSACLPSKSWLDPILKTSADTVGISRSVLKEILYGQNVKIFINPGLVYLKFEKHYKYLLFRYEATPIPWAPRMFKQYHYQNIQGQLFLNYVDNSTIEHKIYIETLTNNTFDQWFNRLFSV